MTVDWTKPILCDGIPARVLATDIRNSGVPVVIAVSGHDREHVARCDLDGCAIGVQRVTNAPERVERWVNVYADACRGMYESRELAATSAGPSRCGVLRVTFEDDKLVAVALEDL